MLWRASSRAATDELLIGNSLRKRWRSAPARPYIGPPGEPQSTRRHNERSRTMTRGKTLEPGRLGQGLYRLLSRRQSGQQFGGGFPGSRMAPLRRDFGQRGKHESALVQSRVRQHEAIAHALRPLVVEQVE